MRITRVVAVGLKGRTIQDSLAPVTVIIGPTGSGKTARLQAIELALLGTVRGEPERPLRQSASGVLALARDGSGEVKTKITLDDGRTVRRVFAGTSEKASTTKTESDAAPDVSALAFGLGDFFTLSPAARRTALLSWLASAIPESSVEDVRAFVKAAFVEKHGKKPDPEVSAAFAALRSSWMMALEEGGLQAALARLKQMRSDAKRTSAASAALLASVPEEDPSAALAALEGSAAVEREQRQREERERIQARLATIDEQERELLAALTELGMNTTHHPSDAEYSQRVIEQTAAKAELASLEVLIAEHEKKTAKITKSLTGAECPLCSQSVDGKKRAAILASAARGLEALVNSRAQSGALLDQRRAALAACEQQRALGALRSERGTLAGRDSRA